MTSIELDCASTNSVESLRYGMMDAWRLLYAPAVAGLEQPAIGCVVHQDAFRRLPHRQLRAERLLGRCLDGAERPDRWTHDWGLLRNKCRGSREDRKE
jgi:hypothetical protein